MTFATGEYTILSMNERSPIKALSQSARERMADRESSKRQKIASVLKEIYEEANSKTSIPIIFNGRFIEVAIKNYPDKFEGLPKQKVHILGLFGGLANLREQMGLQRE